LGLETKRLIANVAPDLSIDEGWLRNWVRQAEANGGRRRDMPTSANR
jgi:transposase-like protein